LTPYLDRNAKSMISNKIIDHFNYNGLAMASDYSAILVPLHSPEVERANNIVIEKMLADLPIVKPVYDASETIRFEAYQSQRRRDLRDAASVLSQARRLTDAKIADKSVRNIMKFAPKFQ